MIERAIMTARSVRAATASAAEDEPLPGLAAALMMLVLTPSHVRALCAASGSDAVV